MPEQAATLRDMIQAARTSGDTYRSLSARAIDPLTGTPLGKDTFNKIVTGRVARMPSDSQLRAIAAALRAPYESVRQAAIAQWLPEADSSLPQPPPGIDPARWASWDDVGRQQVLDAMKIAERRRARVHSKEGTPQEC
jgi:hypothetical protein